MMKTVDKQAVRSWDEYLKSIREDTVVDVDLGYDEREKRRAYLEAHPVEWIKEMFPKFAKYEFANFHKRAIKRILAHPGNWYEVLSWARELAKSTVVMFIVMFLVLTGKKRNIILTSNSNENAVRLLNVYRAQLEANQRIQYYYGEQRGMKWTEEHFITKRNVSFFALGARQSPRGFKLEEVRPDVILVDDFDTDEECRNPEVLNDKWNWFEQALYFTRSFSEPLLTVWCGNVIAKDCCISRAGKKANELAAREKQIGNWDIVNIRMVNINRPDPKRDFAEGVSVWPEKNSEEIIDEVLAQVSTASGQKECFNNPVTEGAYFKEITWGVLPPLNKFPFLISYGDPAPSNKTAAGRGVRKLGSFKSNVLLGVLGGKLYVATAFLNHVIQDEFVNWYYYQADYVKDKTTIYNYVENNKLQDPFYEQVIKPLFQKKAVEMRKIISITPDLRDKPDKFARIEAALEPLNRAGNMIFNLAEKNNPHMQRLEEQFLLFDDGLPAPADGPDGVEGGFFCAQQKLVAVSSGSWAAGIRPVNKKRY
jgi:hypothetical protein